MVPFTGLVVDAANSREWPPAFKHEREIDRRDDFECPNRRDRRPRLHGDRHRLVLVADEGHGPLLSLATEYPTTPGASLCVLLRAWGIGPGLRVLRRIL